MCFGSFERKALRRQLWGKSRYSVAGRAAQGQEFQSTYFSCCCCAGVEHIMSAHAYLSFTLCLRMPTSHCGCGDVHRPSSAGFTIRCTTCRPHGRMWTPAAVKEAWSAIIAARCCANGSVVYTRCRTLCKPAPIRIKRAPSHKSAVLSRR